MSENQQDGFNIPGDQAKTIDHQRGGVVRPDVMSSLISNISINVEEDEEVEQTGQRVSPPIKKKSQNLMQEDQEIMKKVAIPIPATLDHKEGSGSEINARKVAARKRMSKSQLNLESPNDYSEDITQRQNVKKNLIRRDNSQSQGFNPSEIDSEFRNKKQGSDGEENMYEPDSSEDISPGSRNYANVRLDYENIDIEQIDSDDHQEHHLATANNSEEGSEMIMSDSSQGLGQQDDAEQLQNINNMQNPQVEDEEEKKEEDEDKPREEMGGILIYDSYAKFRGCDKIDEYFDQLQPRKVQTDILFSKNEIRDVQRDLFGDKARERDFGCEQDKLFFRNMPRFQPQRDFTSRNQTLYIPNQQNILIFDSRFENGNLRKVAKVSNIEYNLWLENDMNTKGHTQWYYFKVVYKDVALHAEKKTHRVKMNILNLAKTTSLYQIGMKPCIWSKRAFEKDGQGWTRGGDNITYTQNKIPRYENLAEPPKYMKGDWKSQNTFLMNNNGAGEGVENYYTFSFTYEFEPNQDDEVWFAHAIPYTYTDMQEKLAEIRFNPSYSDFLKMNIQCFSLGKNPVPLITITENISTYLDYYEEMRLMHQIPNIVKKAYRQKYARARKLCRQGEDSRGRVKRLLEAAFEEEIRCFFEYNEDHFLQTSTQFQGFGNRLNQYMRDHENKKAVFITSRVHPGEPQASHMLDGFLKYLLSDEAAILRKHFVFRIVPMLNPDGVIYGNYRCSLLGCDLNRKWEKPNRLLHPTIFHSKQLIRHMHQERKIVMYCDLHGHSRKNNAFFYGCSYKNYEQEGRIKNAQLRIIPLLCCQRNKLFSLRDCKFNVEKCKESTARVVVWREMNIMNAFTLEASFFGKYEAKQEEEYSPGLRKKRKIQHFDLEEYNSLGKSLLSTIHSYLPSEQSKLQFISGKILDVFYDEFIKFIPPYILKREEEKRKKLEGNQQKDPNKAKKTVRGVSGMRTRDNNTNSLTALNMMRRRSKAQNQQAVAKETNDNVMSTRQRSMLSGIQMDQNHQSISSIQEKIGSEQRAFVSASAASGKDDTDGEIQKFQAPEKAPRKAEMMEFESFITGIQNKIKIKERIRKKKIEKFVEELVEKSQQQKNPKPIFDDKGNVLQNHLSELNKRFADDSSSGSTSEEETFKTAQKKKILEAKKQKQMEKTIKKLLEKREQNKKKREKQTQKAQSNSPSKLQAKENNKTLPEAKREKSKTINKVGKQKTQVAEINNSQPSVDARNTYTNQNFTQGLLPNPHLTNSNDMMQMANIKALVNKAEKNSHGQIPLNQVAIQNSIQQSMQYSKQISSGRRFKQPPSFNSDNLDHNNIAANVINVSNSNDLARDNLSITQLNEDQLMKFQNHYLINSLKTRKSQDDTGTAMSHIQIEDMQNDNLNFLPIQPRGETDKNHAGDNHRKYVGVQEQRNSQLNGTHQSIQKANSQIDITRNVNQGIQQIGRVQTYARADHASLGNANHNAFGTQKDFRIKEGSKQRHPPRLQQLSGESKKEKSNGPKLQQTYEFDPNDPYKKQYNSHGQQNNLNSNKKNQNFPNLNEISKMREGDHLHLHFILVGVDKNSMSRSSANQHNIGTTQSDDEQVVVNQNLQFNDKTQKHIKQSQHNQQMKLHAMQRSQMSTQINQLTKAQQIQQQKALFVGREIPQGHETPNEVSYRRTQEQKARLIGAKNAQGNSTANPPSLSSTGQNGMSGKHQAQSNPNMVPSAQTTYETQGDASPNQDKNLKNVKKKIYESNIQDLNKARQNILQAHSIVAYNRDGQAAIGQSQNPMAIESKTTMRKSKVYQSPTSKTHQNNGRRFHPSEPVTLDMLANPHLSKSENKNMGMSSYMQSHIGQNLVQVRPLQARQNFSHVDQQDSSRQQSQQILGSAIGNQYTINRLKKQMMRAPAIVNNQITQNGTNINIYLNKEGQQQVSNQNLPSSNPLIQGNHVNLFSDMSKELNSDVRLQNMMRQQQMTQLQRSKQEPGSKSQQNTGKQHKGQRQPYNFDDLPMVGKISAQTAQKSTQQSQLSSLSSQIGKNDMLLKSALNYQNNIHASPSKYHMGNQLFNNSVETIQKQPLNMGNQMVPLSSLPKGNMGNNQHRKDHMVQQIIQLVQKNQTSTYVAAKEPTNQAGFQLPLSLNPPAQSVLGPPDRYSASDNSNGGLIPKTQKLSSRKGRKL